MVLRIPIYFLSTIVHDLKPKLAYNGYIYFFDSPVLLVFFYNDQPP